MAVGSEGKILLQSTDTVQRSGWEGYLGLLQLFTSHAGWRWTAIRDLSAASHKAQESECRGIVEGSRHTQEPLPHGKKQQASLNARHPSMAMESRNHHPWTTTDEEGRERYLSLKNASGRKTRNRRARAELSQNSERRPALYIISNAVCFWVCCTSWHDTMLFLFCPTPNFLFPKNDWYLPAG